MSAGALTTVVLGSWLYLRSYRFEAARFAPDRSGARVLVSAEGQVLRRLPGRDTRPGREAWVPLADFPAPAQLVVIASEDQGFYAHLGVSLRAWLRAFWLTLREGRVYGASTLTMQLARLVYSQGQPRTLARKVAEMRAALGIERHLSKAQILEQYLNRAYYGHGAYGLQAAAARYFGKEAAGLSVGEATLLSVLPRGPSYYDPLRHRERALRRRAQLFALLLRQGKLSEDAVRRAEAQPLDLRLHGQPHRARHFVDWVQAALPRSLRHQGGVFETTLSLRLQEALAEEVKRHVRAQRANFVSEAAAVVLRAEDAGVLAMVGSADPQRALNMATRRRHPGSALKPFVYGEAMARLGHGPATMAYDIRDASPAYRNAGPERGPVAYREALAGSYNFAAMHVMAQAGVSRVMQRLTDAALSPLALRPSQYGDALALGSTRVRLVDLVAAYGLTVAGGRVRAPFGLRALRQNGLRVWQPESHARQVFSPQVAWLLMDMLSDPEARRPMFGEELPVDLPYPVVAKTGTSQGFADAVTVLATREFLVGAWCGRLDGKPLRGRPAMEIAAPLARRALLLASRGAQLTLPRARPAGLERAAVCPLSGQRPGPHCPHRRHDTFLQGTVPTAICAMHQPDGVRWPARLRAWVARYQSAAN